MLYKSKRDSKGGGGGVKNLAEGRKIKFYKIVRDTKGTPKGNTRGWSHLWRINNLAVGGTAGKSSSIKQKDSKGLPSGITLRG